MKPYPKFLICQCHWGKLGVEDSPTQYYLPLGFDYTQQDGRRMIYDRGAGSSVQCWNLVAFKKEYIQQNAASVKVGRLIQHFNPLVLKKILFSALDRASKMLLYSIILAVCHHGSALGYLLSFDITRSCLSPTTHGCRHEQPLALFWKQNLHQAWCMLLVLPFLSIKNQ